MSTTELPTQELERLTTLRNYQILYTEAEKDFDGIVELASQVCETPIALISFIDEEKQWFKAKKGIDFIESDRSLSFCTYCIEGDDIMVVPDTLKDHRFSLNSFVTTEPRFRFYAGVPINVKSGHNLGTLCVIDKTPRELSSSQIDDLKILANQVVKLLELRLRNLQLKDMLLHKTSELSHVFDRIGEAFLELDKNWEYVYVNKRLGELVHRDPQSLIGKNVWAEFPDAIGSATYHAFHQAMKEQRYICHVDYYPPLNLWQENHIYPSTEGLCVFIRDISERKSAEDRLVKSIRRLQRAEEQAKMGSWTLDSTSGKRTWSKQLFQMLGFSYSEEPPSVEDFLERIHPEDRAMLSSSIEKMNKGLELNETIIRTNPGILPLKYLLTYSRKTNSTDNAGYLFEGIMIDVTELQKTNNELDHFVYSVSHDLRAPLSTILGLINVAEMEKPEDFSRSYYRNIRDQVTRLDSFIRDILDYSFNARSSIKNERIEFETLIDGVIQRVSPFIDRGRVKVEVDMVNIMEFYTDKTRLEIILNNLYSNSIKYQDLKKDFCLIHIKIKGEDRNILIQYSDNGIGIEEKHLENIFAMFYRASHTSQGSGLGLYIAKEAISKLGGSIKVTSRFGLGTTFTISIPNQY